MINSDPIRGAPATLHKQSSVGLRRCIKDMLPAFHPSGNLSNLQFKPNQRCLSQGGRPIFLSTTRMSSNPFPHRPPLIPSASLGNQYIPHPCIYSPMTPYEVWDGDVSLITGIRDKRKAKFYAKQCTILLDAKDARVVYRTPARYRGSPE